MEENEQESHSTKGTLFCSVDSQSKKGLSIDSESNSMPSIKNELMVVQNQLETLASNNCISSQRDHLQVEEMQDLTSHKSVTGEILNSTSVLDHQNIVESDVNMGVMNSSDNTLTLSNQYYDGLNPASIMVYQVPSGNIVPFDSIVPVSFEKPVGVKQDETDELLQNSLSHDVYDHSSHSIQHHSLYILPNDPNNIFIDKSSYNRNDKCGFSDQINTAFNLAPSSYESAFPSTSNMNQFSMSVSYSSSTINTSDSEVALTLASLGNLKSPHINNTKSCVKEETSDIYNKHSDSKTIIDEKVCNLDNTDSLTRTSNPTRVLRSRKSRGGSNICINNEEMPVKEKRKIAKKMLMVNKLTEKNSSSSNQVIGLDTYSASEHPYKKSRNRPKLNFETNIEPQKENLLGQLLKASKHCEPASLIPEGVVDDVIPAVGYRIMDMSNLSEMIRMMHRCSHVATTGPIVIQEQASLREGVVSQLSIICTGCQEGAVCSTSSKVPTFKAWDINSRIEQLTNEFNIDEKHVQRMLEILGIFYRPTLFDDPLQTPEEKDLSEKQQSEKKKRKWKLPRSKTLQCQVCYEMFHGENHLKSHMNLHNNSLHRCPYCQAYFKKTYNLKEHIKKHENHKYECSLCHNKYADKSTLHTHIKTIHENRSRLECDICSKKFWIKSHFKEHLRLHTGEKPYSCDVCGKNFMWLSSLKKHMKTHSAESKYKCRLCGKWFRWLLGVRQHLLHQHKLKKSDIDDQVVTAITDMPLVQTRNRIEVIHVSAGLEL